MGRFAYSDDDDMDAAFLLGLRHAELQPDPEGRPFHKRYKLREGDPIPNGLNKGDYLMGEFDPYTNRLTKLYFEQTERR